MVDPILIAIVDDRHDVLELNRILREAEGYETAGYAYAQVTPTQLEQRAPEVMLFDLMPGDEAPWELLRRLRRDERTREIGVVVTSDAPDLVERALRDPDLAVAAGLVMPFDIEALYSAIGAAARRDAPPTTAAAPAVSTVLLRQTAAALRRDRTRVLVRWVQRLSAFHAFQQRPDLSLAELRGEGRELLDGIAAALDLPMSSADAATALSLRTSAAHAHAFLRRAQGIGVGDLAREFTALRREVWRVAHLVVSDGGQGGAPARDDMWALTRRLDAAVDESLAAALDAWGVGA